MIGITKENDEVLYSTKNVTAVNESDLQELKTLSLLNKRKRIRLCAHRDPSEKLHDMIIVHHKDCYVRPHKHESRAESITILEGEADLILFKDDGSIIKVIRMGELRTKKVLFYRISEPIYHMLIIRSEFLTFHEATEGPFNKGDTTFPEWSPVEDSRKLIDFMDSIEKNINNNFIEIK